jgi:hypothetical protein
MGRFYNNRGMSVNIIAATNTSNNRRNAFSMRRPVNTPFNNVTTIVGKLVFFAVCAKQNARNNGTSIARQRSCKHLSLTKEDGVFRGVLAEELS